MSRRPDPEPRQNYAPQLFPGKTFKICIPFNRGNEGGFMIIVQDILRLITRERLDMTGGDRAEEGELPAFPPVLPNFPPKPPAATS
jgi:hypothetical protein